MRYDQRDFALVSVHLKMLNRAHNITTDALNVFHLNLDSDISYSLCYIYNNCRSGGSLELLGSVDATRTPYANCRC
jgi:hypothetical protein